jgi:hypothetical protein
MAAKEKCKSQSVADLNHLSISKPSQHCIPSWCVINRIDQLNSRDAPQTKTSAKRIPVAILIGLLIFKTGHAIVSGLGLHLGSKRPGLSRVLSLDPGISNRDQQTFCKLLEEQLCQ